jgi:hypothetical protein
MFALSYRIGGIALGPGMHYYRRGYRVGSLLQHAPLSIVQKQLTLIGGLPPIV